MKAAEARIARPRDAEATRGRILDAAAGLFARKGFDGVRLREIAEHADATVPLLCHHFGDKETLYRAVVDRALAAFAKLGWDVLRSAKTFAERLESLVHGLIDLVAADTVGTALLHREFADGGQRAGPLAERWLRPVKQATEREIRAAQRRGEVRRDLDPELLVLHIIGAAIYPAVAEPIVRIVWDRDPLAPAQVKRRKEQLVSLLLPLVLA